MHYIPDFYHTHTTWGGGRWFLQIFTHAIASAVLDDRCHGAPFIGHTGHLKQKGWAKNRLENTVSRGNQQSVGAAFSPWSTSREGQVRERQKQAEHIAHLNPPNSQGRASWSPVHGFGLLTSEPWHIITTMMLLQIMFLSHHPTLPLPATCNWQLPIYSLLCPNTPFVAGTKTLKMGGRKRKLLAYLQ